MATFRWEGLSIAYDHAGSGDPIVFLHNLGGNRTIWQAQFDSLAQTNSVYALDWPGYGDSDVPVDGYAIENHQRLLAAFIDSHQLRDPTLVGNCFGSAMALIYARRNPQDVRALVLVNPLTGATLRPTMSGWAARLLRKIPLASLGGRIRLPAAVAALVLREQLGVQGRRMSAATFAPLRQRWTRTGALRPVAAILPELPRLSELDSFEPDSDFPPITTIWGAQNRVLSAAAGARLNTTLSPQHALTLSESGHLAMIEDPEPIIRAIETAAGSRQAAH